MAARILEEQVEDGEYAGDGADNDSVSTLGGALAAVFCATPLLIASFISVPAYAIAMVVMGTKHIDDCKIEPMIPVWLIVHGASMLVRLIMGCVNKLVSEQVPTSPTPSDSSSFTRGYSCLYLILRIFYFAWLIAGSVWVFQAWAQGPDYAHYWLDTGCHKSLFLFAFCNIIIIYIIVGVVVIGSITAAYLKQRES